MRRRRCRPTRAIGRPALGARAAREAPWDGASPSPPARLPTRVAARRLAEAPRGGPCRALLVSWRLAAFGKVGNAVYARRPYRIAPDHLCPAVRRRGRRAERREVGRSDRARSRPFLPRGSGGFCSLLVCGTLVRIARAYRPPRPGVWLPSCAPRCRPGAVVRGATISHTLSVCGPNLVIPLPLPPLRRLSRKWGGCGCGRERAVPPRVASAPRVLCWRGVAARGVWNAAPASS